MEDKVKIALLVGLGAAIYAASKSKSATVDELYTLFSQLGYTGTKLANIAAILGTATRLGYSDWRLLVGMVANAIAESSLDNSAVGDGGHSVGLFQLNDRSSGAPWAMASVESRQDPVQNTEWILKDQGVKKVIEMLKTSGYTASDAAWDWCYYVERPLDRVGDANERKAMVQGWGLA